MNYWNILDIEPTVDIKVIKRAYASKLKLYHPEDNPEGFQKLREAYEAALKEAKYIKEVKSSNISNEEKPVLQDEDVTTNTKVINTYNNFKEKEIENDYENLVDKFMDKVHAIYNDFFKRIDVTCWKTLLEDETFWGLSIKKALNFNMLKFLMNSYHLPQNIWILLNEYFFWTEQEDYLYKQFDEAFIDFIFGEIYCPWNLRYKFFKKDHDCDYDEFINLRFAAYNELMDNNLTDALKSLKAAMELFSDDPDLLRMLGTYYLRVDNLEKAKSAFTHLIEVNPKEIDGYLNRGYILIKHKKIKAAYYDFQQALSLIPDNVSALKGLAECYFYFNNLLESKVLYEQISDICPYDIDSRVRIIEINTKLIDKYNEEITSDPKNVNIIYELAKVYFEMDSFEKCYQTINKIAKNVDMDSDMYLLLARTLSGMKKEEESLKYFDKALAMAYKEGKNGYEILFHRGLVSLELENYDAALSDLNSALKINRYDAEILHNIADAYRCKGDYTNAVELSNEAIRINPSKWVYYSTRGLAHFRLNNFKEAIDDHEVVVNHEYSFSNAWYRKGYCHLQIAEYEEALKSFKEALDWHTSYEDIHLRMSLVYFKLKDFKNALSQVKLHCEANPKDPFGIILMGDIHRAMGNTSKAEEAYLSVYELNPDSYKILKILAYYYLGKQEFKKAFDYFDKMLEINKDDEGAYINFIWICAEINDFISGGSAFSDYDDFIEHEEGAKLNPYTLFHFGVMLYKKSIMNYTYKLAANHMERAIELGLKSGDLLSYLSMTYYELGDGEKSLKYAKEALEADPSNEDYKARYKGILEYKSRKGFFIFKTNPSSMKSWPSTKPLDHYPLNSLSTLNISIGDNYEEYL